MKTFYIPYEILAKHLSGHASDKEKEEIRIWRASSLEAKLEYEAFLKVWDERYFDDEESALINQEEIGNQIWDEAFEYEDRKYLNWIKVNYLGLLKVAAIFALVLTAVFFKSFQRKVVDKTVNHIASNMVEKRTLSGQKSTISLPDGTVVWLNSGSKITYSADFWVNNRTLILEGQAFFDVFKNPKSPFSVKCRNVQVQALGTSFDVNAYDIDHVQVSLLTGIVRLIAEDDNKSEMILSPGQFSIVDENNLFTEPNKFDENDVLAWKEGKLVLRNMKLKEIIPILELWYGVQIDDQTNLKTTKHFNGTFERESLQNVLENISLSIGFEYKLKGKTVELK